MQKTSLILALALAFTPAVWAENVNINGTGVSIEANKTPINTAKTAMRWHSCRKIIALPCREIYRGGGGPQSTAADGVFR
jgi:hypothetical protein